MSFVVVFFLYNILLIENISGLSSSQLSSGFVTQHHIFLLAWRAQAQLWRKLLTNQQPHKVHQTTNPWAIDLLNQIHLIWSFTASSPSDEVLFLGKLLFVHLTAIHEIKGKSDGLAQLKVTWTRCFWYVKTFPCPHFPKRLRTLNGNVG